jgi:hypothetical protein
MATCRSAVSLASALAHVLLPEGRCRVLLIKLNPGPLRVTKCLTHVRIVTTLEYGRNHGDVGHQSPEAPPAYGGKFGVKLAMHGSHAPLTLLRRAARALFRVLRASRPASSSSPVLVVASSSPSSAISTWREMSSSEISSTSSVDSSTTVASGLPS